MLNKLRSYIRLYKSAFHALSHQGLDILKYMYCYVPSHRNLFDTLKQFKGIHEGERCFIVATGPSLTIDDVNKLKGEICWTCNSGINLFNHTDWRPTYYAIADANAFRRIKKDLDKADLNCAFYNRKDIRWKGRNVYPLPMWVNLVLSEATRKVIPACFQKKRMSRDISKKVYMGGNITNVIIQICFYMGFKEIYLLGCDCNYQGTNIYSDIANYKDTDKLYETADYIYHTMIEDHKCALREAEKRGVKIYNATRGGMLEVYERVNLDNVPGLK